MSLFRNLRYPLPCLRKGSLSTSSVYRCTAEATEDGTPSEDDKNKINSRFPKYEAVSVETSIEYLKSPEYKEGYGDTLVWSRYRRNFKGQYPPRTRKNCVIQGIIKTATPCPICRDKYLVVDFRNVDLIKQFVSPYGGEVYDSLITGVCQKQHKNILIAVHKAKDYGLLPFDLPHRYYNYKLYYKPKSQE